MRNLKEEAWLNILKKFRVDEVSHPCEYNWDTSKFNNERIPYSKVGSTFEVKGDLGEGCSLRDEFDDEDLQTNHNFYDTPT